MERIGIRELRQHASRYIERVKAGGIVEITERGQLVAQLVAPAPAIKARERLISAGRLRPASIPFTMPDRKCLPATIPSATDTLEELRNERFK